MDTERRLLEETLPSGSYRSIDVGFDMCCVETDAEHVVEVCRALKTSPQTQYEVLISVTAVDDFPSTPRFEVVYHLLSMPRRRRCRVRVRVEEDRAVPSVTAVWSTADWHERETFDMFGIPFDGHPDLRRLHMPELYPYHPLRKDFPEEGIDPGRLYWEWERQKGGA